MTSPVRPAGVGVATLAVHGRRSAALEPRAMATPLVASTTFELDARALADETTLTGQAEWWYSRVSNPTVAAVADRVAALEGADAAVLVTSGMAAIQAVLAAQLPSGSRLVAAAQGYGDTLRSLSRLRERGVLVELVDAVDVAAWAQALQQPAAVVFMEAVLNPGLRVPDLPRIAELAVRAGATTVVDATFVTPINMRPLDLGADIAVHSATKFLGGHSDLLGGVVAGDRRLIEQVDEQVTLHGSRMDAATAVMLERSLKTLPLRVARSNDNAAVLARWLTTRADVSRVVHPALERHPDHALASKLLLGGLGLVTFELAGSDPLARVLDFLDRLRIIRHATSLGGVESLASSPVLSSHRGIDETMLARAGISRSMVRLAVGIEDSPDLIEDLRQALDGAYGESTP